MELDTPLKKILIVALVLMFMVAGVVPAMNTANNNNVSQNVAQALDWLTSNGYTAWAISGLNTNEVPYADTATTLAGETDFTYNASTNTLNTDIITADTLLRINGDNVTRTYTNIVATSNTPRQLKSQADYVGDGTADDVEIQAAIDNTSPGGKVYISDGNYDITSEIAFTTSNITIEMSPRARLTLANGADCNIFSVNSSATAPPNNTRFITIKGGWLDGNKVNQTTNTYGIMLDRVTQAKIIDVHADNFSGAAIYLDAPTGTGGMSNPVIEGCYLEGNIIGIDIDETDVPEIVGTRIEYSVDYGIRIVDTAQPLLDRVLVFRTGNATLSAVYLEDTWDERITNSWFGNNQNNAVHLTHITPQDSVTEKPRTIITDNWFNENRGTSLLIDGGKPIAQISTNQFVNSDRGVAINNTSNHFIANNNFFGHDYYNTNAIGAIEIANSANVTIENNIIDGQSNMTHGIDETGTSDNNTILYNKMLGATTIRTVGSHTVTSDDNWAALQTLLTKAKVWYPPLDGFAETETGTANVTQAASLLNCDTGTTAGSLAIASMPLYGWSGSSSHSAIAKGRIDWRIPFYVQFTIGRITSDSNVTPKIQIKETPAVGDLADNGFGIKITNLAIAGETYGTSGENTTATLTSLTLDDPKVIGIYHNPVDGYTYWYGNGVKIGEQTESNYISNVSGNAQAYLVISINNNTGGTNPEIELYNIMLAQWIDD